MSTMILKINEFVALKNCQMNNLQMRGLVGENFKTQVAEPLFESNVQNTDKTRSAIIVLPYSVQSPISIESLSNTVTQFLKSQTLKDSGFSISHYFAGEHKSGESVWNEKSLCVSLIGEISDRAGMVAVAVEIMRVFNLPRILILDETCALEITRDGSNQVKPLPQHLIRRIGE